MSDKKAKKTKIIEPRVLKGFRDSLPAQEIPKRKIINKLETLFSTHGFVPIDTPALEYTEVLLGKGGGETDKQIFSFQDNGKREVALRFDLTVPFARFLAAHYNEVALPFKRYHINKVWRGENPQKGRFREFYQCDFDIVGADNAEADFEILSMMNTSFSKLGIQNYTFCVAHRGLFNAFLKHLDVIDESVEILRCVDKLRKIGEEEVKKQLVDITGSLEKAESILSYITKIDGESFLETVDRLSELAGNEVEHSQRIKDIYSYLLASGIESHFTFDPSITRGLDYYTGIVYETFLDDLPSFGSVCSGGRYNNLASLYTKQELPGVGSSIGLDRLLSALEELDNNVIGTSSSSDVVIFNEDAKTYAYGNKIADALREQGLRVDHYLIKKKLNQQFKYAETNQIPFGIIIRENDEENNTFTLKNLNTRNNEDNLKVEDAVKLIKQGI
jgi:histidyl-tRNA synthetase